MCPHGTPWVLMGTMGNSPVAWVVTVSMLSVTASQWEDFMGWLKSGYYKASSCAAFASRAASTALPASARRHTSSALAAAITSRYHCE